MLQPKVDRTLPADSSQRAGVPVSAFDRRLHASYRQFAAVRHWFARHITLQGGILFWAMLAAGSFNDVSVTMAHQLFGFLFCFLLCAVLCLRKPRRVFCVERGTPRNATVGVPFTYPVRILNSGKRWQRGLEFWEGTPDPRPSLDEFARLSEPGEARRNWFDRRYRAYRWSWLAQRNLRARTSPVPIPDLPPGSSADFSVSLTPLRRGRLTLSRSHVARTDPFGLFRRHTQVQEQPASVVVYPRRFRLPYFELPGAGRQVHTGGVAMAGSVGESEEFLSVREYRPGDPLRKIHWAGWARHRRPVVKEYQEEFFVRHALLLDTAGGGAEADAFEDAVSLAASFASRIDDNDSLLDLMFVGDRAYTFTTGRGLAHQAQILEVLAGVSLQPDGDVAALEGLVLRHTARLSGCVVILLNWDENRSRLVNRLRELNLPMLLFVHQPQPSSAPNIGIPIQWIEPGKAAECLARWLPEAGARN